MSPHAPQTQIVARGLTKHFGAVRAVDDVSFVVEPGRVTGFLGANGAGKTTTLRILLGLVAADHGRATIAGEPYADLADPVGQVGAVLDPDCFHPGRTASDHLRIHCRATDRPLTRAGELLELVGLSTVADRRVGGFSLGMRQRLALAHALVGDPQVLVLDEPANGLDPGGMAWLRRVLRGFADEGRTVLLSSHVLAEVQQLVDDVLIMSEGRLLHAGPAPDHGASDRLERFYLAVTAGPDSPTRAA